MALKELTVSLRKRLLELNALSKDPEITSSLAIELEGRIKELMLVVNKLNKILIDVKDGQ